MKAAQPIVSLIIFAAGFAAIVWWLDRPRAQIFARQHHTESFAKTQGQVISADTYTTTGSKGTVFYHPRIAYAYMVAGQKHTARRYRYDGQPADEASVDRIVHDHPVGSTVDVYYDPNNPAVAVLSNGLVARDVSFLFLLAPYNLIFLYGLVKTAGQIAWPGTREPVAGGVKLLSGQMTTRVRLPRFQPGFWGWLTVGVLLPVAGLVIQVSDTASPLNASVLALLLIVATGGIIYAWQYQKIASGLQDLVLHFDSRTVELPLTFNRRERQPLRFSTIAGVTVEKVARQTRSGTRYIYAPTLQMQDGSTERLTILAENRAEAFAAWLRKELGLK